MPRNFIRVGCTVTITGKAPATTEENIRLRTVEVIHSIRAEDTFFSNPDFCGIMKMVPSSTLIQQNPGVHVYKHRITSDAVSMGVFNRFAFTIKAVDPAQISPRFGVASKIIQPACGTVSLSDVISGSPNVTFTLDGALYKIDPESVSLVGGRKYR